MRPATQQDHMQRVQRVVAQLQSELDRTLTVGDMADIAAMSPFHVIRVFRHLTGYTPAAMQTALRIQAAKRYMIADGASVTDACFEVGFNSLGSFSQRFKDLTGVNPSDYRTSADRLGALIDGLAGITRTSWIDMPTQASVSGVLTGDQFPTAYYFVGLFPPGPPRGIPVRGDARIGPGDFVIRHVPDGLYVIYSAVIERSSTRNLVMPDLELATGGGFPVLMASGRPVTDVAIDLETRSAIITPVMTTLFAIPTLAQAARFNHEPSLLTA